MNLDDLAFAIIACPPASEALRQNMGITNFTPPPGAIETPCQLCGFDVWLGIKGLACRYEHPDRARVLCYRCAMMVGGVQAQVKNLGGISATFDFNPDDIKP